MILCNDAIIHWQHNGVQIVYLHYVALLHVLLLYVIDLSLLALLSLMLFLHQLLIRSTVIRCATLLDNLALYSKEILVLVFAIRILI